MTLADLFSDLYASLSFTEVYAEKPPSEEEDTEEEEGGEKKTEEGGEDGEEKQEEEKEEEKEEGDDGGDDGGEEDQEEEEEEEEEEVQDIKPKLEEECARSAQCADQKHHFNACAERVTAQHEDPDFKGPKEDCVEEFFHLSHCAAQCAAPKLFRTLK